MVKDIFDSILEKDYSQLTSKELTELAEYCQNEDEFLAMKQVLQHSKSIADGPKLAPRESTKESLDTLFDSTYGKNRRFTPFYFNAYFQIAALIAVGFAVWMFVSKNQDAMPHTQLAENTIQSKTAPAEEQQMAGDSTKPNITLFPSASQTIVVKESTPQHASQFNVSSTPAETSQPNAIMYSEKNAAFETTADVAYSYDIQPIESLSANTNQAKETTNFKKVSAPATSVEDISVDISKRANKPQAVTSMNAASQRNVVNYLTVKF